MLLRCFAYAVLAVCLRLWGCFVVEGMAQAFYGHLLSYVLTALVCVVVGFLAKVASAT